ncbi:STY4851/ECs_5259 family protein [Acinetobacter baumannii]|uniref:STY4851/ECs_5259 family protein n=1 Tax=Acinetobacter junii TaxID=40215 RepID=UPI0022EB96CF|nr:STY4851/ECs_5259 family protein [Acinetobacter junii]MCZ3127983.1 STY4851/ECs_5259 family protein [Acinetobacter baumannii]MDA3506956.1 STY4851/ECs_5259 family protein [Acinetobacter junii]MDA3531815.1 STY4851/ECs_5259 family protein [Acinetobacter junii]
MMSSLNYSPRQYLEQILITRGLASTDARVLYQYQLSFVEFKKIEDILKKSFQIQNINHIGDEWAKLFTLYAAEWFRREYTAKWTWDPILTALDIRDLPVNTRNEVVVKGLRFWKRPIIKYSKANNYLGSIFKEGGFPSRLLKEDGNRYISIFQKVTSLYLDNKSHIDELRTEVQQELKTLPQAFEHDETLSLVLDIVRLIIEKVESCQLTIQQDPIATLDQQSKHWRNEFPLPIDEDQTIVDDFLRNLFKSASEEISKHHQLRQALKCTHSLSEDFKCLSSTIYLPEELSFALNEDVELRRTRGNLVIKEGLKNKSQFLCTTYLLQQNNKVIAEINRGFSKEIYRQSHNEALYLCLEVDGVVLSHIELEDTALDFETLPIAFEIQEKPKYIAQGALKTKASEIFISLPIGVRFINAESVELPEYVGQFLTFKLYKIRGQQRILTQDDDQISIKCGHSDIEFEQLLFRKNNISQLETSPSLAFIGKPTLKTYGTHTLFRGKDQIESTPLHLLLGQQMLTLKNRQGESLLKKKVVILPPHFKVMVQAGMTLDQAILDIESDAEIKIEVLNPHSSLAYEKTGISYNCQVKCAVVPLVLNLKITFKFGGECIVTVPFPTRGLKLISEQKEVTSKELVIHDLLNTELKVYSYDRSAKLCFEIVLKTKKNKSHDVPFYRTQIKVKQGISLINLYEFVEDVKSVLSVDDDLDSYVECTIRHHHSEKKWNIRRYAHQLNWGESIKAYYNEKASLSFKPQAMSLVQPQVAPLDLFEKNEWIGKVFQVPELDMSLAPYLLIPAKDSTLFRAKLIPEFDYSQDSEIDALTEATRTFGQNKQSIKQFIRTLNHDNNEAFWDHVKTLLRDYSHLPLNTFEVLKALATNYDQLAMAVFKLDLSLDILRRFETELSVLWFLIPVSSWQNATLQLIQYWQKMLGDDGAYGRVKAEHILKQLKSFTPLLAESFHAFYLTNQHAFGPEYKFHFLNDCIFEGKFLGGEENSEYQRMLQRNHSATEDQEWPTAFSQNRWIYFDCMKKLPFSCQLASQWNKDVVYLPFCLAYMNVKHHSQLQLSAYDILQIKQTIAFDEQWFNQIFSSIVKYLILEAK